jgi:hypothetical protein
MLLGVVVGLRALHGDVHVGAMGIGAGVLAPSPWGGGGGEDAAIGDHILNSGVALKAKVLSKLMGIATSLRIVREVQRGDYPMDIVHDIWVVIRGARGMGCVANGAITLLAPLRVAFIHLLPQHLKRAR